MNDIKSVIRDKWHDGIDAAGLKKLTEVSTSVNSLYHQARQEVARYCVEMGRLLGEARALFKGDHEYGVWCAEQFPWAKRTMLYNLRMLAEQVGDHRLTNKLIDTLPLSTVFELLPAPDVVREKVAAAVEAGEKPTVKEVRELKREASTPAPVASPAPAPRPAPRPAIFDTITAKQRIVDMPSPARYRELTRATEEPTLEHAYLMFGLDPDPCIAPSMFSIDAIYDSMVALSSGDKPVCAYIAKCAKLISDDRKEFNSGT